MSTTEATFALRDLCEWSAPKRVNTRNGERILQTATPPAGHPFWDAWKQAKDQLKAMGISVSKDEKTGQWGCCWWQEIPAEEKAVRAELVERSRAVDADINVPAPSGLDYLPYQRGGIAFALRATTATATSTEKGSPSRGVLIADEMGL